MPGFHLPIVRTTRNTSASNIGFLDSFILISSTVPPEGWSAFFVWLTKNIKYPEVAKQANQQAVVSITFIINSDGTVDDIKIKESKNPIFEAEVLRVVRTMGKWKPGIQNNKPCKSLIEIPVVFSLG